MQEGYIRLHRSLLCWGWFRKPAVAHLWQYLLLAANWKDGMFKGEEVKRGQLATSYPAMAEATGLSIQNVRTAVATLKKTGEITVQVHHGFSVITVVNYEQYQSEEKPERKPQEKPKRFVPPTVEEVRAYCEERGNTVYAEHFCDYYTARGWKVGNNPMKDWKAAVRTWEQKEKANQPEKQKYKIINGVKFYER